MIRKETITELIVKIANIRMPILRFSYKIIAPIILNTVVKNYAAVIISPLETAGGSGWVRYTENE